MLEGFHALKHALRFGAEVLEAVAVDAGGLEELAAELAPDLAGSLAERTAPVSAEAMAQLVPQAPRTGVVALARRPEVDVAALLAGTRPQPLVLLEDPRTMGNMGACVRVAAAADAAGVLTTGSNDPWHPDAVRAAAGLHFALPVAPAGAFVPDSDTNSPDAGEAATGEPAADRDRPRGGGPAPRRAAAAGDPRLRQRAIRPQRGAARRRRRPPGDPDARRRLQPQPRHRGRRRALRAA